MDPAHPGRPRPAPPAAPAGDRGPLIETERLELRELTAGHAGFILELLNDRAFLRYIGDKNVRTSDEARRYIEDGPRASYARHGFGMYAVELRPERIPIGICGLVKRDALEGPDLGFAFLPRFRAKGYAHESAAAVLRHAREAHGLQRVLAITSPDNTPSIQLLSRLGFRFERMQRLSADDEVKVFASEGTLPE